MEHILTECKASGQHEIWKYIELLYEKKGLTFKKPSLGDQLGCTITKRENEGDKGTRRFMTIMISEASYKIWKIRCEWRIGRNSDPERMPTQNEIKGRIRAAIARKMKTNCLATDNERFGKKAIGSELVKDTWSNLAQGLKSPLRSWKKIAVVLVGIG